MIITVVVRCITVPDFCFLVVGGLILYDTFHVRDSGPHLLGTLNMIITVVASCITVPDF